MRSLTLLYDPRCGACRRLRTWLAAEPAYLPLEVLSARAPDAHRRFPGLSPPGPDGEAHVPLTAVSDAGEVWRGVNAWRLGLWALRRHRARSLGPALFAPPAWQGEHPAGVTPAWPERPDGLARQSSGPGARALAVRLLRGTLRALLVALAALLTLLALPLLFALLSGSWSFVGKALVVAVGVAGFVVLALRLLYPGPRAGRP